jgi:hypothetical protein
MKRWEGGGGEETRPRRWAQGEDHACWSLPTLLPRMPEENGGMRRIVVCVHVVMAECYHLQPLVYSVLQFIILETPHFSPHEFL